MSPVSQYFMLNNSEYWSQKCTQNGNTHSTKLGVYAEKQRASNFFFILAQDKQGRNYSYNNNYKQNCLTHAFGKSLGLTGKTRIPEKKLRLHIQQLNGEQTYACQWFRSTIHLLHTLLHCFKCWTHRVQIRDLNQSRISERRYCIQF